MKKQFKAGKSTITMTVLLVLVILFIAASGCTGAAVKGGESAAKTGAVLAVRGGSVAANEINNDNLVKSDTAISVFDETDNLEYNYIIHYLLSGDQGYQFNIKITTDGAPVDILILDENNYLEYSNAFEKRSSFSINGVFYKNVVSKNFKYTLPSRGKYYLVIENSKFLKDGADAKRAVNYQVSVDLIR